MVANRAIRLHKLRISQTVVVIFSTIFCLGGLAISYYQTKQNLEHKIHSVMQGFESTLGQTLNNLGLVSRLSTVQSSLYFGAPEPSEKILNQSIYQEPFTEVFAIFDRSKKLFTSNIYDSKGAFTGTPEFLLTTPWAELPSTKIITDKYGEVEMLTVADSNRLLFQKKILKDDEEIGSLLIVLNGSALIQRLLNTNEMPESLSTQYFLSTVPTAWHCAQSEQFKTMSICGVIEVSSVLEASKSIMIAIFVFSILIGLVLLLGASFIQKEAQKELAVKKALVEMASQVAHDIRSPLAVLGSIVKDDLREHHTQDQVSGAVERIRKIANTLLGERGKYEKTSFQECVGKIIENVISEKQIEFKNVRNVKIEFKNNVQSTLALGERIELSRILSNILNNAYEAIPNKGFISVELSEDQNSFEITVKDNGKGIPKDQIGNVFNRGFSYDKESGNGLGLSYAREIIEKWNGTIHIESQLNHGTTIRIKLPKIETFMSTTHTRLTNPDLILIDNDPLVLKHWSVVAKRKHLCLLTYKNPEDLKPEFCDKNIPIYVDKNLDDGISGINVAQDLMNAGFKNIYLCTGDSVDPKALPPYIKGVIGKDFPTIN